MNFMRSYKEILKDELVMKNRYDGWTVKGMEEKLKEIEEKEKKDKQNKSSDKS
tara:strand:- start:836 stop:994 length:159 start_codon:yes stop_codon:yes gene_type:complete